MLNMTLLSLRKLALGYRALMSAGPRQSAASSSQIHASMGSRTSAWRLAKSSSFVFPSRRIYDIRHNYNAQCSQYVIILYVPHKGTISNLRPSCQAIFARLRPVLPASQVSKTASLGAPDKDCSPE